MLEPRGTGTRTFKYWVQFVKLSLSFHVQHTEFVRSITWFTVE